MTTQGLPRRIKRAFIAQAVLGSVVLFAVIVVASLWGAQRLQQQRIAEESQWFWHELARDPDTARTPHTSTLKGYFVPASGAPDVPVPEALRRLPPGMHVLAEGRAYVEQRPEGTLYVSFSPRFFNHAILAVTLPALVLALLSLWLMSWLTYRISKRLVVPVAWLAERVRTWDPRNSDAFKVDTDELPADSGVEVRRLSRALVGLNRRVHDFVRRERDFTRDASHELRTPLTVVRLSTDMMLAREDLDPPLRRSLTRVQAAGREMEAVIDAFMLLAREAEIEAQSEDFDVADVVAREVAMLQPLLADRPVTMAVEDRGGPRLHAPAGVLALMLRNLLSNAVQFTTAGTIRVIIAPDHIQIADTGIGMTPDVLAKVFDPFYKADLQAGEGKGVGMSIVHRLGERVGWPVSLASEPGKGTTATIQLVRRAGS
ncbi:sensor histidine kinase [Aerolutibacter ruishenii]|uniref:histidine kinase n=1 Tax=Aerolutibacter ruishenii TaxID=686800 RepID=A0A562M3A5_9GAMM|nr:HAMP domain-containing sensor histidine kinase [Lysobacter ruishenii]TWI14081.1 signal transduction histidine kinase [Lysobacter ruishenii]